MPTMSPVPPRTVYQPPIQRDPGGAPYEPDFTLPDGSIIPVPQAKAKLIRFGPRYGPFPNLDGIDLPDGSRRILVTGGVTISVTTLDGSEMSEFSTDDAVIWIRGGAGAKGPVNNIITPGDGKTEVEVYMAGNVIIRSIHGKPPRQIAQTVRAEEVYYDAEHNRAVALRA